MVDAKVGSEEKFIEYLDSLETEERFDLTVKLTEIENSIKTQRIFETEKCPESLENFEFEINNKTYLVKYLQLNDFQFSLILEQGSGSYFYSRNY